MTTMSFGCRLACAFRRVSIFDFSLESATKRSWGSMAELSFINGSKVLSYCLSVSRAKFANTVLFILIANDAMPADHRSVSELNIEGYPLPVQF